MIAVIFIFVEKQGKCYNILITGKTNLNCQAKGETAVRIAICDDEAVFREHTERECKRYFGERKAETDIVLEPQFSLFSSGEELLQDKEIYDILFLDIEMPGEDGISIKEYFEKERKQTRIIFLTSHDERVMEAFGKNVIYFLRKPLDKIEFEKAMNRILSDVKGQTVELEENGETIMLPVKKIKYIEAQDKYTTVIWGKEKCLVRKTMKFWEDTLPKQDFCRIHKSYLINFEYFIKEKDEVILNKEKRIKLSRKNKEEILNRYREFLRGKLREN